jgi:hypothetical protein
VCRTCHGYVRGPPRHRSGGSHRDSSAHPAAAGRPRTSAERGRREHTTHALPHDLTSECADVSFRSRLVALPRAVRPSLGSESRRGEPWC